MISMRGGRDSVKLVRSSHTREQRWRDRGTKLKESQGLGLGMESSKLAGLIKEEKEGTGEADNQGLGL